MLKEKNEAGQEAVVRNLDRYRTPNPQNQGFSIVAPSIFKVDCFKILWSTGGYVPLFLVSTHPSHVASSLHPQLCQLKVSPVIAKCLLELKITPGGEAVGWRSRKETTMAGKGKNSKEESYQDSKRQGQSGSNEEGVSFLNQITNLRLVLDLQKVAKMSPPLLTHWYHHIFVKTNKPI